jgi:hypothetical protein
MTRLAARMESPNASRPARRFRRRRPDRDGRRPPIRPSAGSREAAARPDMTEHHVEGEECRIFPAARTALTADEAMELAGVFLEAKRDVMGYAAELEAPIDLEVLARISPM